MAEDYPAMIESFWTHRGPQLVDRLVRNPHMLRRLEKFVVRRIQNMIVVSEASKRRLELIARPQTVITVIRNTPTLRSPNPQLKHDEVRCIRAMPGLKLIYTGFVDHDRGLDIVIRAVKICLDAGLETRLIIIGKGNAKGELESLSMDLRVNNFVHFLGWIDSSFLSGLIEACDIGVVPHRVTAHTNTTVPNKLFDYMAVGKPIITSNAMALKEIVTESRCGEVFEDGSVSSLYQCIRSLSNEETRTSLGSSGKNSILTNFNWETDERILLKMMNEVDSA